MNDKAAFLRAIYANPDDDAPRLVYADWLDEHGDPEHAEFIRVQIQLAMWSADLPDADRQQLYARESELLEANGAKWTSEFGPFDSQRVDIEFTRGFPARLNVRNGEASDLKLLRLLPSLERLSIENCSLDVTTVRDIAGLQRLESLELDETALNPNWFSLLEQLPCWTVVRSTMQGNAAEYGPVWDDCQKRRVGKAASLPPEQRRDAAVHLLRGFDYRDQIRLDQPVTHAILQQVGVTDTELELLAYLSELESVYIYQADVTAVGLQHLSGLSNLRSVELSQVNVNSITPLTRCVSLERLEVNPNFEVVMGDGGTEGLERLTNLRKLVLSDGDFRGFGDATFSRLASLRQLRSLEIQVGPLDDENCLSSLSKLTQLETLILQGPVSDHALPFLAPLKGLRTLSLASGHSIVQPRPCQVTEVGARELAEQLPSLTILVDGLVIRASRKTMAFRRYGVSGFASALFPSSWGEYRGDPWRHDKDNSMSLIEEGITLDTAVCARVGPGYIRISVRNGDATTALEQETHRSSLGSRVLERDVVKLRSAMSCVYWTDPGQHLVCAMSSGGRCAVLNCEAPPSRFEEFRPLFMYIARSLRVGKAAMKDVGEEKTVAVSRL